MNNLINNIFSSVGSEATFKEENLSKLISLKIFKKQQQQ